MRRIRTVDAGPKSLHLEIEYAHPNVISGGAPGRIRAMAQFLDPGYEKIEAEYRGMVTVHGTYKGMPVTAFSTQMGPSSVSLSLPEVIEACDIDDMNIIRIGTSGGTRRGLNVGDVVASTWYERGETLGDKIRFQGYRAETDPSVRKALIEAFEIKKQPYQKLLEAPTRTSDDFYWDADETKRRVQTGEIGEVAAVSMEGSIYCAIRDSYNKSGYRIQVGELLVVSDDLTHTSDVIDGTEFAKRGKESMESAILAGFDALLALRNGK